MYAFFFFEKRKDAGWWGKKKLASWGSNRGRKLQIPKSGSIAPVTADCVAEPAEKVRKSGPKYPRNNLPPAPRQNQAQQTASCVFTQNEELTPPVHHDYGEPNHLPLCLVARIEIQQLLWL